jgi:hypothetical protein
MTDAKALHKLLGKGNVLRCADLRPHRANSERRAFGTFAESASWVTTAARVVQTIIDS